MGSNQQQDDAVFASAIEDLFADPTAALFNKNAQVLWRVRTEAETIMTSDDPLMHGGDITILNEDITLCYSQATKTKAKLDILEELINRTRENRPQRLGRLLDRLGASKVVVLEDQANPLSKQFLLLEQLTDILILALLDKSNEIPEGVLGTYLVLNDFEFIGNQSGGPISDVMSVLDPNSTVEQYPETFDPYKGGNNKATFLNYVNAFIYFAREQISMPRLVNVDI